MVVFPTPEGFIFGRPFTDKHFSSLLPLERLKNGIFLYERFSLCTIMCISLSLIFLPIGGTAHSNPTPNERCEVCLNWADQIYTIYLLLTQVPLSLVCNVHLSISFHDKQPNLDLSSLFLVQKLLLFFVFKTSNNI